jgi:aldehyde dehydrogenase (NAD+)
MGRTAPRQEAGEPGFSRESIVAVFSNFIGGEQVAGTQAVRNINPSNTDDVVGEFASGSAADVTNAVAAAKAAFPAWSRTTPQERYDILKKASDEVLARKEELGRILSREEGKILAEGIGEAARAGQILAFFAGECVRLGGETIPSVRPGVGVEMTREPIGVVALITPWNFPIAIPAWKIAPALAYGNTVVIKPAEIVPHSTWALVDILQRAGLPKGVLNLVMGKGSVVGDVIVKSPDVRALTFTGSVGTGRRIAASSVEVMRKFQLEMGGKNPLVVLDDADLKTAVECALNGAFFSTGQRCTASSRLVVTQGIHERFVSAVTEKLKSLVVDNALKQGTQIGIQRGIQQGMQREKQETILRLLSIGFEPERVAEIAQVSPSKINGMIESEPLVLKNAFTKMKKKIGHILRSNLSL